MGAAVDGSIFALDTDCTWRPRNEVVAEAAREAEASSAIGCFAGIVRPNRSDDSSSACTSCDIGDSNNIVGIVCGANIVIGADSSVDCPSIGSCSWPMGCNAVCCDCGVNCEASCGIDSSC
jgi:hypothetical protein